MKKYLVSLIALFACALSATAGIRVMSYNIRYGAAKDGSNAWSVRRDATTAMLKDLHPAVFGVQEALDYQIQYILESCPEYAAVGVGRDDGSSAGEHMSVFYDTARLQLLDWGTWWLSETPDEPSLGWDAHCRRTATWTLFKDKLEGTRFFFVNTHLDHAGAMARRNGLALIYDKIGEMNPSGLPMVLTGDFNVLPDDDCLKDISKLMKDARYNSFVADEAGSFNGYGSLKKDKIIDYIYYSGFDASTSFRVVNGKYAGKKYISDHYPVYSDLAFARSRIESGVVKSSLLGVDKKYKVYLPKGYDLEPNRKWPVLYLLHGAGGTCDSWLKYNMKTIADWRISSGFCLPMVIVMPDASGPWENHRGPRMGWFNYDDCPNEDFFFQEFIPEVEARYRIVGDRTHRAVAGLSMGGGGTAIYGMHHPEYFSSACPLSGRVEGPTQKKFGPELQEYVANIARHDMVKYLREATPEQQEAISKVRWYIDCGDDDYLLEGSLHLYMLMRELGFPCANLRVREGDHQQEYWHQSLQELLTFVSMGFWQEP